MTKTRVKKSLETPKTMEEASQIMGEFAIADAKHRQITAKMDERMNKIRCEYADELEDLAATKDEKVELLQRYAEANPTQFEPKKSMEFTHGKIGFRTGTPKLKTLKGFTWAAVLNLLNEYLPNYVRTVQEPDKAKLIADRENPETNQYFKTKGGVGIEVVQDESFYVEAKTEEAEQAR